jgi:hypothetical protein
LGRARPDEVADHDEPSGDAYANLQRRTTMRCEPRNRLDKTEPGANCSLSVMFMRLGVAKIGENAVTHVFCNEATIALDLFGAAAVINGNDVPQVLGVEPSRQRRRANQVAKHDSELASLRRCGSGLMFMGGGA